MAKRIHSSWFFFRCGSNATSVLFFLVVPGFTGFLCEMLTILTVRRLVPRVFYFISTAFILVPIEQVHVSLASICPRPVIIGNVGTGGKGFLSLSLSLSLRFYRVFNRVSNERSCCPNQGCWVSRGRRFSLISSWVGYVLLNLISFHFLGVNF